MRILQWYNQFADLNKPLENRWRNGIARGCVSCCQLLFTIHNILPIFVGVNPIIAKIFILCIVLNGGITKMCTSPNTLDIIIKTMKEKGITSYRLFKMGFPQSNYYAIKHGENISTNTINQLCVLLQCEVSDILKFLPEDKN